MEAKYITLTKENIEKEHICCAFSDKKCKDSYELKKTWLKNEFENGYVFRRLDERAKVFIEYGLSMRLEPRNTLRLATSKAWFRSTGLTIAP